MSNFRPMLPLLLISMSLVPEMATFPSGSFDIRCEAEDGEMGIWTPSFGFVTCYAACTLSELKGCERCCGNKTTAKPSVAIENGTKLPLKPKQISHQRKVLKKYVQSQSKNSTERAWIIAAQIIGYTLFTFLLGNGICLVMWKLKYPHLNDYPIFVLFKAVRDKIKGQPKTVVTGAENFISQNECGQTTACPADEVPLSRPVSFNDYVLSEPPI